MTERDARERGAEDMSRSSTESKQPVAESDNPTAESDGTITIHVGLWPVLGLAIVVGGLLFGVWLARGGLAQVETAASPGGQAAAGDEELAEAVEPVPGAGTPALGPDAEAPDMVAPDAGSAPSEDGSPPAGPVFMASDEIAVLAIVDGREITSRDVDLELIVQSAIRGQAGMALNDEAGQIDNFRREILEHVLDQTALISAAVDAGLDASDQEAAAGIPTMGSQLGVDGTALYEAALAAGITDAEYVEWVRGQLAIDSFLSSEEARLISAKALVSRGMPADQAAAMPANREAVAASVSREADIVLMIDGQQVSPVVIGEPAPDVTLVGLDGQPIALSDLRGRPLVLNFWATWCVPCRIEMPILQAAHEQHGDEVMILGVSVDEAAGLVSEYIDALGLTFPIALDPDATVATLFRVRALPTTYFIDADGIVVESHRGAVRTEEQLAPLLETVLPSGQSLVR